jgi:hypothetical protein
MTTANHVPVSVPLSVPTGHPPGQRHCRQKQAMSIRDKTRDVLHQSQSQSQSQSPFLYLPQACCLHQSSLNLSLRNARARRTGLHIGPMRYAHGLRRRALR